MPIIAATCVPHPPLIVPAIGKGEEKKIQSTIDAYKIVASRIKDLNPDTIIITSPHSIMYADYFHISPSAKASGDLGNFRAPKVKFMIKYDTEFVSGLSTLCGKENIAAGQMGERDANLDHGTMIPLHFLKEAGIDFTTTQFVRIGLSGLPARDHYRFGQAIAKISDELNRKIVFLASGDLSHKLKSDGPYGFAPEAPIFDDQIMKFLSNGDFLSMLTMNHDLCEKASECGLRSFWIMSGALDRKKLNCEQLSYEGPFGVGYGITWFKVLEDDPRRNFLEQHDAVNQKKIELTRASEDPFVKLARMSVETFVKTHKPLEAVEKSMVTDEILNNRAGVFVSLKKDGRLRGCIGTFMATRNNLLEEIIFNAISACSRDPRFDPVTEDELGDLVYDVDVLTEPERIFSIDKLDPKKYGIIVGNSGRRGLLLPDLDGVDTVEQQIAIAKRKANISPKEPIELWRFEVVRHL